MSDPAPTEMTRDERIRWILAEEAELLRLLPVNNGHAALAEQHMEWLRQMDVKFVQRVTEWTKWAEEFGVDPSDVTERFEYNWQIAVGHMVDRLYRMGELLKLAPDVIKAEYQDVLLVSTNTVRWAVGIGAPEP